MNNKMGDFLEKKIYACSFMGKRLNLNPYTFSFCHETFAGRLNGGELTDSLLEDYNKALYDLIEYNMCEESPCRKCPKCIEKVYEKEKITFVAVSPTDYCNSSCIYCAGHYGKEGMGYNPIKYIEQFYEADMFASNCFFDWGGGEPTLSPFFESSVKWLFMHNFFQRINTNAIIYSETTQQALQAGMACVRISIDSGTRKCFEMVKGHEHYDAVWENIAKYCNISEEVYIKYNVFNYNSDEEEIKTFVNKCKIAGVKNIIIDAEISSYQPSSNAGPFYFTQKEFAAAHLLEKMAKEEGFNVKIGPYSYSVRGEYDEVGNLCLPTKYFNNLDTEVLSHNISVKTYPNMQRMINELKQNNNPKAIWGIGKYGKICYHILQKCGVEVDYLIDSSLELQESGYLGKKVHAPEEFLGSRTDVSLILAGNYWKQMLKEINERNIKMDEIIYMRNYHYDNL